MKKVLIFVLAAVMVFGLSACNFFAQAPLTYPTTMSFQDRMYEFLMETNKGEYGKVSGDSINGTYKLYFTMDSIEVAYGAYDGVFPSKLNDFTADEYLKHCFEAWENGRKAGFTPIPQEDIDKEVSRAESIAKDNENFVTLIFTKGDKIVRKESIDNRLISFDEFLGLDIQPFGIIADKIVDEDGTVRFKLHYAERWF